LWRGRRAAQGAAGDPGLSGIAHVIAEPHDDHALAHDVAVLHDDHVDFLHDGHRHAPHGDHYDEH